MSDEPEIILCDERPFPNLSACVREAGHDAKCVFARGRGDHVTLYERGRGRTFKAIFELELKRGARLNREEAHAMLAVAELLRDKRE